MRLGRKRIPVEEGDTVASALYRAGIRTFSRSLKYHRRRGLYCGTGECPNCLLTVDGVPGVRSCVTPAIEGMRVRREHGWPSVERDVLSILDRLHVLLPVGFYYKTFIRPRWLWGVADRIIRRAVGLGRLPSGPVETRTARHLHCDVLVVGAGASGRAAAVTAAAGDERVVLCDEGDVADPPAGVDVLAAARGDRDLRGTDGGARLGGRHRPGPPATGRGGDGWVRGPSGLPGQRPPRGDAGAGGRRPRGTGRDARAPRGGRGGPRRGDRAPAVAAATPAFGSPRRWFRRRWPRRCRRGSGRWWGPRSCAPTGSTAFASPCSATPRA